MDSNQSFDSTNNNSKHLTKKQKKKMAKLEKKDNEMKLKLSDIMSDEETETEVDEAEDDDKSNKSENDSNIDDHLRKINDKLNNVLTKDDTSFIRTIIKYTVNELKETLLASVIHKIEKVEGELHTMALENDTLKKEVKYLTKKNQ